MTETKKRTRAPKQLSRADLLGQLERMELKDQLLTLTDLQTMIDQKKTDLQQQIELINANGK
jgi:hypothetical protein